MRRGLVPLLVVASMGWRSCGRVEAEPAPADPPSWRVDAAITGVGALIYLLSDYPLHDALAPDACRWCEPPRVDEALRDALVWSNPDRADLASDVLGFWAAPTVTLGLLAIAARHDGRWDEWRLDALLTVEALVIAKNLNQLTKMTVGRERPFVHHLAAADKPLTEQPQDNNLSFYSGHVSFAVSLATAAGTVASRRGRRWAHAVWGGGLAIAATTGWLRIAADRHWTSDVVVGAVVSGAVGAIVPRLRLRRIRIIPAPGGAALAGTF